MKKQLLTVLGTSILSFGAIAQDEKPANLRHPCNTFEAMEEGFKANPKLRAQFEASQAQFEQEYQAAILAQSQASNKTTIATYTIPIVFHIMGDQNISDQVFINLVSYFNRDYAKQGADTSTIDPAFASLYKDSGIRFALAQKDPNGNCTDGIIRHSGESIYWSQSSPNYKFSGTGTNRWPTNKYLNIYIVECIASVTYSCPTTSGAYIGGYTYLPGSTPYTSNGNMGDAIVLLKNQLAQSNPLDSRTISHEIGHWLNLSHTFGSSNNPKFDPSNMPTSPVTCSSDFVSDTPPTGGYFSICTASSLDCSSPPNIENIMDYASCPKMFTQGQITRMTTALNSATGGRNNLWTNANYLATGLAPSYTCTPVADFMANKGSVCAGSTVTYTSTSFLGNAGGSVSWNFQGGTPATSTNSIETVTYPTAGAYSISIAATNPQGTNTKTVSAYMNVYNTTGGAVLPATVDFETGLPAGSSVRNNEAGSPTWIQNTSTGGNSTAKSIYINNFSSSNTKGNRDFFETPYYDLSNTSNIGFSFYYAYAKKAAAQIDSFKVFYTFDCGSTWSQLLGVPAMNTMAANSGGTVTASSFVPTAAQWKLFTATPALLSSLANKPNVRFRFYFMSDKSNNGSNNMYIDQINLTGNVTTTVSELEKSLDLLIYPNPTNSSATIDFNLSNDEKVKITVTDVVGRLVEEASNISNNSGKATYTVNKASSLAKGVYIINLEINNQRISKKLVIE